MNVIYSTLHLAITENLSNLAFNKTQDDLKYCVSMLQECYQSHIQNNEIAQEVINNIHTLVSNPTPIKQFEPFKRIGLES